MRQGEGRRLCVVAEQALAAPEHDGMDQKPKLVHQPGCEQLAHHVAATPRQQVGAVLVFERAYRVSEVALERMAVLPVKRIGSVRSDVLGHAVEPVSDGVAAAGLHPFARPIRREYLVGTTPQQQLERLGEEVLQGLADELVGVGHYPATEAEVAAGIFVRATGGLNNAIETDLFGNGKLAHTLLPPRPAPAEPFPTESDSSTIGHHSSH